MARVCAVKCDSYDEPEVKRAFDRLLGEHDWLDFVKPGMRIVIKANLVSMMKPASAATTHPELLKMLCVEITKRGASAVIGDSPGGLYTQPYVNAVYTATGVKALARDGVELNQDFSHLHAENPGGHTLKELDYTAYLDSADAIINFCKLKTHGMMGMSCAVKNLFGCIPGVFKPEYHYKYQSHSAFANMLVDLNERFKPKLILVDAVDAMEGNGPTAGTPRHVGALIAADSPYACDRVCAGMIGIDPDGLETVKAAKARGLENGIELSGDAKDIRIDDFKLVRTRGDVGFHFKSGIVTRFVQLALISKPKVHKRECVGCGKCANVCPAKAIEMSGGKPRIDRKACIRCFCCQEFCPKGAMKLHRPLSARIINKTK